MEWDKFSEGASVGFDNFIEVAKGEKTSLLLCRTLKIILQRIKLNSTSKPSYIKLGFEAIYYAIFLRILIILPKQIYNSNAITVTLS